MFSDIDSDLETDDSDEGRHNRLKAKKTPAHVDDSDSTSEPNEDSNESTIDTSEPPTESEEMYDSDADIGPPENEPPMALAEGTEVIYNEMGVPVPVPAGTPGAVTVGVDPGAPPAGTPVSAEAVAPVGPGGVAPPPPTVSATGAPLPPQAPAPPVAGAPPPAAGGAPAPPRPKRAPPPPRPKAAAAPVREFYKGKKPEKKMKVMHWDTYAVTENPTMWHKVHDILGGDLDCSFDYEEFEAMFSQKEKKAAASKEKVKEVVILIDGKKFQNISIMMHKMPSIPEIQRAVRTLDNTALDRDKLEGLLSQVPTEDEEESFKNSMDKKPQEEYEPPEQFFAMVINSIEFTRRCKAWMFTIEWDENVSSAQKPIGFVQEACDCILSSKHLPLAMGIVLGFGNYMNAGSARGNAPGFTAATLSKLEMTRDTSGKLNLLQYVVHQVIKSDESALNLPVELAPLQGVQKIKVCFDHDCLLFSKRKQQQTIQQYDDIENGSKKLQGDLMKFKVQVRAVKEKV